MKQWLTINRIKKNKKIRLMQFYLNHIAGFLNVSTPLGLSIFIFSNNIFLKTQLIFSLKIQSFQTV
nr:MAG TPA: hypothetical protein [Caudoviricetes sp.]